MVSYWYNDEHEHFGIILDWLEDNEFAFDEGEVIATNIVTVRRVEGEDSGV